MPDRFQYDKVRQMLIDAMRTDLMGPMSEDEVLTEKPQNAYIIGMLAPQGIENREENEQEVETDVDIEDGDDYTAGEEDDNEPVTTTHFKTPSSIGISFYIETALPSFNLDISWGDYNKTSVESTDDEGKTKKQTAYSRIPMRETLVIEPTKVGRAEDYQLKCDSNVHVHVSRITLKNGYTFMTAYVINKRKNPENDLEGLMFQVTLKAYSADNSNVFIAEHICRSVLETDEYYFEQRPILGRGRGCAAVWGDTSNGKTSYVQSAFIPEYEFPGVSAALEGFDKFYFSMRFLSIAKKKENILERLNVLADAYEKWIVEKLENDPKMRDEDFVRQVGQKVVTDCRTALKRIREGIKLIDGNDKVLDAFCFMNRSMILQRNIMNYSRKHGAGIECNFQDFIDPRNEQNEFGWRPFQIAFILMNLSGIVDPGHADREIVDLLYFPTGGGKTEAYLGLMAFTIAFRRLSAHDTEDEYERDGGVTAILRYTLRLLTTQQRDRITKMVIAAEMIRKQTGDRYGSTPISIGFWVGGGVTTNKFADLEENKDEPEKAKRQRNLIYKQLLTCPFCGKPLNEDNFYIDTTKKSVEIYCSDRDCIFFKYSPSRMPIPVYLVDEEIYARCPTIILSTVDKFARLPWDVQTNCLFGRVDRKCTRHGFVAIGDEHERSHRKTEELPTSKLVEVKPFLPPELIIQDELHLITGPLGTVYGAYETIIEDMCSYVKDGVKIKPKYVVSTATIKKANEQAKCLYARENTSQFPPNGFEIGDSFFIKEIPVTRDPFRKYTGICAPGQSVKTTLLRVFAVILQKAYELALSEEYKDCIDPYYTLVGYFNSIRELGGAVRLLQDDIPKRIKRLKKRYGMEKIRYLNKTANVEITSRMPSYKIPEQLKKLEMTCDQKECLDTAIATNMIAVGMDVDRLGLMVVTGQPKQNSEYIQATSRIGRAFPGLVVTVYNPYRPRDLSHYENFSGYHTQLYRFVEGTTATPFSARARDRVLHALIISAIRLKFPEYASNAGAADIGSMTDSELSEITRIVIDRLNIIKPQARIDAENEIDGFITQWKQLAAQSGKPLRYFVVKTDKYNRLMNYYGEHCSETEKATLNSMREVESSSQMYYYQED